MNKAEISFYHLTTTKFVNALPKILDKIVSSQKRAVIVFPDEQKMDEMNLYLWSFSTKTVIPHGSSKDEFKEEQPVYLTVSNDNPNGASIVVVPVTMDYDKLNEFEKCLFIFDGNDENELSLAREKWKRFKEADYSLTYWKQDIKGAWQKEE
jgi:DNA polymerase-3 subunit chi